MSRFNHFCASQSSLQNQELTSQNLIDTSVKDGERTVPPLDSSDTNETLIHSGEGTNDGHMR